MSIQPLLHWLFGPHFFDVGAVLCVGIALAMALSSDPKDVSRALWLFGIAALLAIGRAGHWLVTEGSPPLPKPLLAAVLFGAIGFLWISAHIWASSKLPKAGVIIPERLQPVGSPISPKADSPARTGYPKKTAASPKKLADGVKPPELLTLHQLFLEEFQDLGTGIGLTFGPRGLKGQDGSEVQIESRLLIDGNSGTKFLSFFLPHTPNAIFICVFLADNYGKAVPLDGLQVFGEIPAQAPLSSSAYPFSRRIFIYHEDTFTPEQIGDLHKLYKQKNLLLELRGNDYVQFTALRRDSQKAHTPKQKQ